MMNEEIRPSKTKHFSFPQDILKEIETVKAQLKEEDYLKHQDEDAAQLEDDLDFRFTALTQGLGFHQDEKAKVIDVPSPKAKALKSTTLYNQNVSLKKKNLIPTTVRI